MILMAILSFQGYYGGVTFPFKGPVSLHWWKSIFQSQVGHQFTNADAIRAAGERSLWVSLAAGAIVALLAFTPLDGVPAPLPRRRRSPSTSSCSR